MTTAGLSGVATACSRICMLRLYDVELDRCQEPRSLSGFPRVATYVLDQIGRAGAKLSNA
jgi:hypothetical protein